MELRKVNGHIEVYDGITGKFLFSADTEDEAEKELRSQICVRG